MHAVLKSTWYHVSHAASGGTGSNVCPVGFGFCFGPFSFCNLSSTPVWNGSAYSVLVYQNHGTCFLTFQGLTAKGLPWILGETLNLKIYLFLCVQVPCFRLCLCPRAWCLWRPEEATGPYEPELQTMWAIVWVLGIKARFSGVAPSALKHQATSPVLLLFFLKINGHPHGSMGKGACP